MLLDSFEGCSEVRKIGWRLFKGGGKLLFQLHLGSDFRVVG